MHQVDEAKFCQQIGNDMAVQVLGLIQLHIDIYQYDGVLTSEERQGLLYNREVGQCGRREV